MTGGRVDAVVELLRGAGCDACAVGSSALELLAGRTPALLRISTDAPPARLLALFPRAAVIADAPFSLALGAAAPAPALQLVSRPAQPSLAALLSAALFRIEALALSLPSREPVDPLDALRDWREGRLAAAASAERIAADPLAALRAARLCAELALEPEAELGAALRAAKPRLEEASPALLRSEVARLLLAPGVARGLALLRDFGVEALLVPGARSDAPELVARLPAERSLRLLGWLRGSASGRALRNLRQPPAHSARLERVLRFHPIDAPGADPQTAAPRLLRRLGDEAVDWLLALRAAELALDLAAPAAARLRLAQLRSAVAAARDARSSAREPLALSGRDVLEALGCEPGPTVGRALRFLAARVALAPEQNLREPLLALLRAWSDDAGADAPPGPARADARGRIAGS